MIFSRITALARHFLKNGGIRPDDPRATDRLTVFRIQMLMTTALGAGIFNVPMAAFYFFYLDDPTGAILCSSITIISVVTGAYILRGVDLNRAAASFNKGDHDRVIADATKAIELDPKEARAYNNPAAA